LFCLAFWPADLSGQASEDVSFSGELIDQLLPIEQIIDLAMENSPTLDYYDASIRRAGHQVDLIRNTWQNNIFGFANYSTGDQRIVTGSTAIPGDLTTSSIATGYRAGIQINIPLYEFTGRKSRIRLHEEERNAMLYKKEELELELRLHLIQEYYKVLGYFEVVKIRSEGQEAMRLYYQVAEQEFKDGIIDIAELSQIKNSLSQSEVYFMDAKYLFTGTLSAFAALVGVPVSALLNNN
jgi:outer membrane protein TolC